MQFFSINSNSVPDSEDFGGCFYHFLWNIVVLIFVKLSNNSFDKVGSSLV